MAVVGFLEIRLESDPLPVSNASWVGPGDSPRLVPESLPLGLGERREADEARHVPPTSGCPATWKSGARARPTVPTLHSGLRPEHRH